MGRNWRIQSAAVEQEILFPDRSCFESYINSLSQKEEPFQVLCTSDNPDGSVTVLMRKRYNHNAFLSAQTTRRVSSDVHN